MCGISGVFAKSGSSEERLRSAVSLMNACQIKRGPDDEGIETYQRQNTPVVILAQRRLAIIDLSPAGHQPMDRSGSHITFNGEIYNFEEVKKELQAKGFEFKTKSDTEVILAGYEAYGTGVFSRLRGMFAIALWDEKENKLFLVRDRYGIKPLYYARTEDGFVFASTVKAIMESGLVRLTDNKDANIYFLTFGSVPLPHTTYNEILSVRAGHFLEINGSGHAEEKNYYDSFVPFLKKTGDSRPEAVKKIKEILKESVRLHLISDAPLGVFLSGGLDSSALAALASGMREKPVTTLGIDFEEKEFSEKKYREEVVQRIKSNHREITVTKKDFEEEQENIFASLDQPSIDGVNTFFVSRAAKQAGLKVVLSGLGSDEIFMGYHYFKKIGFIRLIQKLFPGFIFGLLPKRGKFGRLRWLKEKHPFYSYVALRGVFSPAETAKILKIKESEVWNAVKNLLKLIPPEGELKKLSPADLQSYFDLSFYMANQLLKDTDSMSMAHSIEARVPFLDHILVEYLSSLPAEMKLAGAYPKQLLIDAVSDILPSLVWDRPKMGFTFPFAKWIGVSSGGWRSFWAKKILERDET